MAASKKTGSPPIQEPTPNPDGVDQGKVAFDALRLRLLALDPERLAPVTVDLQRVAVTASAVGRFVRLPENRARFAALPPEQIDMADVDGLEAIAQCCTHVAVSQKDADATGSEARIPGTLAKDSEAVRARMLALCTYHFGDDGHYGPIVRDIVQGVGYLDRASDLLRLAVIYAERPEIVKTDAKNYVATDAADARRLAQEIGRVLGEARNVDQKAWNDLASRALTLLQTTYDEVAQPGRWLFRKEDPDALFPSLYSAARSRRRAAPKPAEPAKPGVPVVPDLTAKPAIPVGT